MTGCVTATSTSLTVSLTGLSSVVGGTSLTATVTTDGVSSGAAVQVATAAPVVTASSATLPANATSLTIAGLGFDSNTANDSVTFDNGVTGRVTSATSTSLTVSLTGLGSVTPVVALHATVTVDGGSSGTAVEVATVAPVVTPSTATLLNTATSFTISGYGFDTNTAHDTVTFDNGVTDAVTAATSTSLTVSVTGLTSVSGGTALHATVTVDGTSSGAAVQVATVQIPVIFFNSVGYSSTQLQEAINVAEASGFNNPTITITGSSVGGVTVGAFTNGTSGTLTISGSGESITAPRAAAPAPATAP